MVVDLVQRVYSQRSKGNTAPYDEFRAWLEDNLGSPGAEFVVKEESYYWKIISAERFNDLISDWETDWMLLYSASREVVMLGKLYYRYINIIGKKDNPVMGSMWLLKCNYDGLHVSDEPIHVLMPHRFSTPKHRIERDLIKLILNFQDKHVEIVKYVDYKTHRTGTMKIR